MHWRYLIFSLTVATSLAPAASRAATEVGGESRIVAATVFPDRAEVLRVVEASVVDQKYAPRGLSSHGPYHRAPQWGSIGVIPKVLINDLWYNGRGGLAWLAPFLFPFLFLHRGFSAS